MNIRYFKAFLCLLLIAAVCCTAVACGGTPFNVDTATSDSTRDSAKKATEDSASPRKLIIDSDAGADDASAIIYAALQRNVEILGVTVSAGNVDLDQGAENVIAALELAGCDAPVYKGAKENYDGSSIKAYSVFGNDGMGDAGLIHPKREAADGDAVDFLIDSIKEAPGEVEVVCLGPVTNIAKALEKDSDAMKNVKRIWSMGTTGLGSGNASPVAEFNVYNDAPAYQKMLASGLPITIIGLDVCGGDAEWTNDQFEELSDRSNIGEFVATSFGKLREFYRKNGSNTVKNCDSLMMMCVLYPGFVKDSVNTYASCVTEKDETYAEVIFYQEGFTYDVVTNDYDYHTVLVTKVDSAMYFNNYLDAIG